MNLFLNIDEFMYENFKPLASHTSVWSLEEPFVVAGTLNLPKPIYSTLNNFMYSGKKAIKTPQPQY